MGVLLGGQHTSNVTGTWLLLHILNDPTVLKQVVEEQQRVMGEGDYSRVATYDEVANMPYLTACLDETLRMYPPFFQLVRKVTRDVEYKDFVIPKGRLVAVSPAAVQRLPDLWDRPNVFDPSRFLPENKDNIQKNSWIPFGGGRHQCTGKKFAITSIKTAVSWLIRNYQMELTGPVPQSDYTTMVVAPKHSRRECFIKYTKL